MLLRVLKLSTRKQKKNKNILEKWNVGCGIKNGKSCTGEYAFHYALFSTTQLIMLCIY